MFSKMIFLAACWVFSSMASADCIESATGKLVCGNGENAGSYNPNTGRARMTETNNAGVKTTKSSRGGEAKTKNGVGVVQTPGGKTCVKTRSNQGCR